MNDAPDAETLSRRLRRATYGAVQMQKIPEKKLRRAREALARMRAGYASPAPTDAALCDEEYQVATGALAMHSEEEITRIMLAPRRERRRLVSVIRRAYRQAKRRST